MSRTTDRTANPANPAASAADCRDARPGVSTSAAAPAASAAAAPVASAAAHADARPLTFAIVTCSDTRDITQDEAGDALARLIADSGWVLADRCIVRDERADIAEAIVRAADEVGADIVLTCGGSGLSLRDVTPEATADVCERNVPGIAEAMRWHSLQITPFAMLSRAVCMQRGRTLVINLPGSTKAATENWEGIAGALPHAVKMTAGEGHGK